MRGSGSRRRMSVGILDRKDLSAFRKRNPDKRIVFTNGCFDILHRGHVALLKEARSQGDCLVVGVNTDDSVRRLKGAPRPLVPEKDRAFVLLELRCVDHVTFFGEDTPLETIEELLPDVLVKGDEYAPEDIVGAGFVESSGGRVVRVRMVGGFSTSALIKRMRGDP